MAAAIHAGFNTMMLSSLAARRCVKSAAQSRRLLSFYSPTLTERRVGEAGTGGRNSEASLKVCLFGASGFLGEHVCSELGTWADCLGIDINLNLVVANGSKSVATCQGRTGS